MVKLVDCVFYCVFTLSFDLGNWTDQCLTRCSKEKEIVCVIWCRWRGAVALDLPILPLLSISWALQMIHDPCTSIFRPDSRPRKKKTQTHTCTEQPPVLCKCKPRTNFWVFQQSMSDSCASAWKEVVPELYLTLNNSFYMYSVSCLEEDNKVKLFISCLCV